MSLPQESIERLEQSFEQLKPNGEKLVEVFYSRLFDKAPQVREMFPDDMTEQKKKLLGAVALAVGSLRSLDKLVPVLEEMGAKHVQYGTLDAHYPVVVDTMLEAMAEVAGSAWTPEVASDWKTALELISNTMIAGAHRAQEKAAA